MASWVSEHWTGALLFVAGMVLGWVLRGVRSALPPANGHSRFVRYADGPPGDSPLRRDAPVPVTRLLAGQEDAQRDLAEIKHLARSVDGRLDRLSDSLHQIMRERTIAHLADDTRRSEVEGLTNTMGFVPDWSATQEAAREFLRLLDSRAYNTDEIDRFFTARKLAVSYIDSEGDQWAVLTIHRQGDRTRAVGIPAIRVGMARMDLRPYFELRNYNGVDHIHASHVREYAELANVSNHWTTTKKGLIDGSH